MSDLYFLGKHTSLKVSMHTKKMQVTSEILCPKYSTTGYTVIENTVVITINVTYARRMMGRLDVIQSNTEQLS